MSGWAAGRAMVLVAVAGALLAGGPASAEPKLPNEFCPVQTDQKAQPEFSTVHEGRTIHFCCEDCLEAFKASPREYLANLAPAPPASGRPSGHDHPPGWTPPGFGDDPAASPAGGAVAAGPPSEGHSPAAMAFRALAAVRWSVIAVIPLLVFLRYREKRRPAAEVARAHVRPFRVLGVLAVVLLAFAAGWRILDLQFQVQGLRGSIKESDARVWDLQVVQHLHYATFFDFGSPPIPTRPPVPKRLSGTFYRGNDEREPHLFNGGNYRTATFHISLRSGGRDVAYGQDLGSAPLFLRIEIERAANTPDFFWVPHRMQPMYLTRETDPALGARNAPIPDRVGLTVLEPLRRWEALYPIGSAPASGDAKMEGLVYVREQMFGGARFHFGIPYDLRFRDGRISPDSEIYMGALYRTRKVLPSKLPLNEWFSHEPIPTLPVARKADAQTLREELDTGTGR